MRPTRRDWPAEHSATTLKTSVRDLDRSVFSPAHRAPSEAMLQSAIVVATVSFTLAAATTSQGDGLSDYVSAYYAAEQQARERAVTMEDAWNYYFKDKACTRCHIGENFYGLGWGPGTRHDYFVELARRQQGFGSNSEYDGLMSATAYKFQRGETGAPVFAEEHQTAVKVGNNVLATTSLLYGGGAFLAARRVTASTALYSLETAALAQHPVSWGVAGSAFAAANDADPVGGAIVGLTANPQLMSWLSAKTAQSAAGLPPRLDSRPVSLSVPEKIAARTATRSEWSAYSSALRGAGQPVQLPAGNGSFQFNSRRATAFAFLTDHGGKSGESAFGHMRGIDFAKPVDVVRIPNGSTAQQYTTGGDIGEYFAPLGSSPLQSGLSSVADRRLMLFQSLRDIKAMRSYTAPNWAYPGGPTPGAGGGLQFYVPQGRGMIPIAR